MSGDTPRQPDPADDERLLDVAGRILDGGTVDWDGAARGHAGTLIDELKAIGVVARIGATPPPGSLGDWGSLRLLERVGEGSFGEVFRAWDMRLDREVALKLLRPLPGPERARSTAIEEGRLLARIRHPNVVTVFGAEEIDSRVGIWTEFVHGETLEAQIRRTGPISEAAATEVGIVLGHALAAVHAAGVIHGDIKPQNVLRETSGRLVLVDLGTGSEPLIAEVPGRRRLEGTPLYMAPELWRKSPLSPQSDIYSLGALLFFLVTGSHPVPGTTAVEVEAAQKSGQRNNLKDLGPALSSRFVSVVNRAIHSDPGARYATSEDFAAALAAIGKRSRRIRAAVTVCVALIGLAGLMYFAANSGGRGNGSSGETNVRLQTPRAGHIGRPSRDGRVIPYLDPERNLKLWDRTTDTAEPVLSASANGAPVPDWLIASPDGQTVAYSAAGSSGLYELRVVGRHGAADHAVISLSATDIIPVDWSADGTQILCWLDLSGGTRDLVLVFTDGGPLRILQRNVITSPAAGASISPDGHFVVFEARQGPKDSKRNVMIAATESGAQAHRLQQSITDDWSPLWTAAGNVVFAGARSRRTSLFVVMVHNGVAEGVPEEVAPNLTLREGLALSREGRLFYRSARDGADVFVAPVDLAVAGSLGTPVPIDPDELDGHSNGHWSPEPPHPFVYIDRTLNQIIVKNASRTTRLPVEEIKLGNQLEAWSPDGAELLIRGTGAADGVNAFFRLNLRSRELKRLVTQTGPFLQNEWRPDGKAIRFRHASDGIVDVDITGNPTTVVVPVTEMPGGPAGFATSPDGRHLLVASQIGIDENHPEIVFWSWTIDPKVQRATDRREVFRTKDPTRFAQFSPNGRELIYASQHDTNAPFHLWILPATGGQPRDLGALPGYKLGGNAKITLHPNGTKLTYMQGTFGNWLHMLENFLRLDVNGLARDRLPTPHVSHRRRSGRPPRDF